MVDLTPFIYSHYINGIPAKELVDSLNAQNRLNDLFSLYDMYSENPCMDVVQCLKCKFKHSTSQIAEDLVYFEYIRTNFTRMTKQRARDLVNWGAEKVMRDAAAVNDRKGIIDAAKVLATANQLDKPEQDSIDKSIRPLEYVYTPYVEHIDSDRKTIDDKKLLQAMRKYDAHIDVQEERILAKVEKMKSERQDIQQRIEESSDSETSESKNG